MKFTFKTTPATGRYRSFYPDTHEIKFKRKVCGLITDQTPHKIRLQVIKKDINEDKNPNCSWKWITLKYEGKTLQETKDFLNANIDKIIKDLQLHLNDND
jgi:hypothetical protein